MSPATTSRKPTILIVDDEESNRHLFETLLKLEGYFTQTANNGEAALAMVADRQPDLILLDVMMPGMDGFQVAAKLKSNPATEHIPVIMATSLDDRGAMLAGLNAGAEEFLTKPLDRTEMKVRVRNILRLKEYSDMLSHYNTTLEQQVYERTMRLRDSNMETIFALTRAAEYKDEDTTAHVRRIGSYSKHLAEMLGMDSEFIENIYYASPMHDIGKIGIADAILLKKGEHTPEEIATLKMHCTIGWEILSVGKSSYMQMGAAIALGHHERWDGSGYPNGKKGDANPVSARIVNLCDVYDALRTKRHDRQAFDHETAVAIITRGDGKTRPEHFDPEILEAFKRNAEAFREIYNQHPN